MPYHVHIINRNKTLKSSVFVAKFRWLVLTWLACRAAADLVICFTMTSLLRARRTGFTQCVNHFNFPQTAIRPHAL